MRIIFAFGKNITFLEENLISNYRLNVHEQFRALISKHIFCFVSLSPRFLYEDSVEEPLAFCYLSDVVTFSITSNQESAMIKGVQKSAPSKQRNSVLTQSGLILADFILK